MISYHFNVVTGMKEKTRYFLGLNTSLCLIILLGLIMGISFRNIDTITDSTVTWTWMAGSNIKNQPQVHDIGSRSDSITWTDSDENFWLFGGYGYDGTGSTGYLNDLWRYDGTDWTWMSGNDSLGQPGVYGTKGIASPSSVPGGRLRSVSWIDQANNLWLFGGYGYDNAGSPGTLNDLWRYDGTDWTWIAGNDTRNQPGLYGTKGVTSFSNVPGSRERSVSWIDTNDNLWLFGGNGRDKTGTSGYLNDLWRYNGTYWTWMSGNDTRNQPGVYGTKGVASPSSVPGSRHFATSCTDTSGNFWLFGGEGYDSTGSYGRLNDLWRYDGIHWTWIAGNDTVNQLGVYGAKGESSSSSVPGSRYSSISWMDMGGNFWLFGGRGYDSTGPSLGYLNDLWRYNGTYWTWMSGSDAVSQLGVYGTKKIPSTSNMPGSRWNTVSWIDKSDNLWLFGGQGLDSAGSYGRLNDLWQYDGTYWIWISGNNIIDQPSVYGTKGIPFAYNVPGARNKGVSWIDPDDNFWLFGGYGYDGTGFSGWLNDLWQYNGTYWTWMSGNDTRNQLGVYGTKGVASPSNIPGSRQHPISWTNPGGSFWLFGGYGYGSTGILGRLNDLWLYNGTYWTWMSGNDTTDRRGVYGTKGVASSSNIPGGRAGCITWIDSSGNLWLFGGDGFGSVGSSGWLNDLWQYDGTYWTWMSGNDTTNQPGVYGTKGISSPSNVPGGRIFSASWFDTDGNLWLFGGYGYDTGIMYGYLNDLWRYDGTDWTWMSGNNTKNQPGVYGTKGVASSPNVPGSRRGSNYWIDSEGNFWLYGGSGYDSAGSFGTLNDLWRYDGTDWTWISGNDTRGQSAVYGTKGVVSPSNDPGGREFPVSWLDSAGNFWLFGGYSSGHLNDLWKCEITSTPPIPEFNTFGEVMIIITLVGGFIISILINKRINQNSSPLKK